MIPEVLRSLILDYWQALPRQRMLTLIKNMDVRGWSDLRIIYVEDRRIEFMICPAGEICAKPEFRFTRPLFCELLLD